MATRINMRANMDRFAPEAQGEFEKGDRVTVTGWGVGTVTRTYRNGDVAVSIDGKYESVFINRFVKRID